MTIEPDMAYRALVARDARFDGHMFVGVTSTGVYCRPICRVRTPQQRNCRFFDSAAQAEAAQFRPCMKCRPELAPQALWRWSVMDASTTLARQAAHCLQRALDDGQSPTVASLSRELGVSDRHLRRIFVAEHGVTPQQFLHTRRLLLAKQLLTDTALPVSQVALVSGFASLRRFNAAFVQSYRMSPSALRTARHTPAQGAAPADDAHSAPALRFSLHYRSPFDHAALLRFLQQRAVVGVEAVSGLAVRRSVRAGVLGSQAGWLEVRFEPERNAVRVIASPDWARHSAKLVAAVRRWLDLDAHPDLIDAALADLPGTPGVRLPGSMDAFEISVRAILGQQVTVAAARTLAQRLAGLLGSPLPTPWPEINCSFPAPECLAEVEPQALVDLGILRTRASAIQALAQAWPNLQGLLDPAAAPEPALRALCDIKGIGPWTAHYIAMRAMAWPDAFLPADVAVRKAMQNSFGTASHRDDQAHALAWRPWRSYAVLRLWASLGTAPEPAAIAQPKASKTSKVSHDKD